jgi:protein-tyrosine phosphatase
MALAPAAGLPSPREPGTPYRVCLVCLGNICRSPMAETVLRAELAAAGLDGAVVVDSAGTGDWHVGGAMDPGARAALARRGHDGSDPQTHRARQFQPSWLARRDLVLAMDARNLADLRRMAPGSGVQGDDRIRLFGEVGGLTEAGDGDIPDPWGGGADEFGHVLDLLGTAAPVIAARLARLLEPGSEPGASDGAGAGDGAGRRGAR